MRALLLLRSAVRRARAATAQGGSKRFHLNWPILQSFRNDRDRRDFVTAGASAGVAAAFRAPVGGLLFGLEELASHWRAQNTWMVFFTNAVVVVTLRVLMRWCQDSGRCGQYEKGAFFMFDISQGQARAPRVRVHAFCVVCLWWDFGCAMGRQGRQGQARACVLLCM